MPRGRRKLEPARKSSHAPTKRVLRSSVRAGGGNIKNDKDESEKPQDKIEPLEQVQLHSNEIPSNNVTAKIQINSNDIQIGNNDIQIENKAQQINKKETRAGNKEKQIDKEKQVENNEIDEETIDSYIRNMQNNAFFTKPEYIGAKIEEHVEFVRRPDEETAVEIMKKIIEVMRKQWTPEEFLKGLMHYLMNPKRNLELRHKMAGTTHPAVTEQEQVILYFVTKIHYEHVDIVEPVIQLITSIVIEAEKTEIVTAESMAHFCAILCVFTKKSRYLRGFVIESLLNLKYRAVSVVKQCFDVYRHILPLAIEEAAKTPTMQCLIYALHFFEYNDSESKYIRNIMQQDLLYKIDRKKDLVKLLKSVKRGILALEHNLDEITNFRSTLNVLARRQKSKWRLSLISNVLVPIMWMDTVHPKIRALCIDVLGNIFVPYNEELQERCESLMDNLTFMLCNDPPRHVEKAICNSLANMRFYDMERFLYATIIRKPNISCRGKRTSRLA